MIIGIQGIHIVAVAYCGDAIGKVQGFVQIAGTGIGGSAIYLSSAFHTVKNRYDVKGNHDDGFQSWAVEDDEPREG